VNQADDKLAEDARGLDPRFKVAFDLPDCFVCGKQITRTNFISVVTQATVPLHAHSECCDGHFDESGSPDGWLFRKLLQAVGAAIEGRSEMTPGPVTIHGGFV
jgi:hypothetical protein